MFHLYSHMRGNYLMMDIHPLPHVVGLGDAIGDLSTEFKIPVLLHPIDAVHQQAVASVIQFENPVGHPILGEFGFEAVLFPGQTAGSIVLHTTKHGGLLLTGDSAMGTTAIRQKPVWSVWLGHQ
jgi:glyoxylase-like metal-dependent hydrolase (beta-lactamase superfamily II)